MTTTKPKLGALWAKTKKDGEVFYNGNVLVKGQEVKIVCWANQFKESEEDNKPHFVIYEDTPRFVSDNPRRVVNPKPNPVQAQANEPWTEDDDIPF